MRRVQVPAGEIIGSYPQEATACTTMHHCWAVVDAVCRFKYVMIGCLNGTNYFSDTTQLCVVSHSNISSTVSWFTLLDGIQLFFSVCFLEEHV